MDSGINDGPDIPESFRQDLSSVLDQYFDLKDDLVASDAESAAGKAEMLAQLSANTDYSQLNPEIRNIWSEMHEKIQTHCIQLSSEEAIEEQRVHFKEISDAMIEMVNMFQPGDYDIYHQQCPMFGEGEADWLSRHEEIQNPYHGDRMMDCGSIMNEMSHGHRNSDHHGRGGH